MFCITSIENAPKLPTNTNLVLRNFSIKPYNTSGCFWNISSNYNIHFSKPSNLNSSRDC